MTNPEGVGGQERVYQECGCGLWICLDCRPEFHGDDELRERLERGRERLADLEKTTISERRQPHAE